MLASGRIASRRAAPDIGVHVVGNLWSGSTAVPSDLLAVTIHEYPKGITVASPAPTYTFHTWRCWDYGPNNTGYVQWRSLHPGSGDFTSGNAAANWADLDQAVDLHYAAGRSVCYCIWGTPGWCASAPAQADPYPGIGTGGNTPPTTQAPLSAFVTRLVNRYNTDTIRNNGGAKKLKYLEIWNEPTYTASSSSFFTGTAADMAAMAKTVNEAAKAVDSTITILSPSFTGMSYVSSFLNASDGAAGFGRSWIDGLAYHPYSTDLQGSSPLGFNVGNAMDVDTALRAQLVSGGLAATFPKYSMEQAIASSASSVLLGRSDTWKAAYVARITALYAALGWQKVTWYSHDDSLSGNPSTSAEVSAALAWAATLAGKTILAVDLLSTGALRVTHSTGSMKF